MLYWEGKNVDPYRILEVPYDVTETVLKQKYRALLKKYHPDNGETSERQQRAIRLINEANAAVEKDIKLRKKEAQEKALRDDDYSSLDLDGLKKAVIAKITNYITEYQVAKVTCEINQVRSLKKIEEFFDQGIAVAHNCIALANIASSREEVLSVKGVFDKKRRKFDENFFMDLDDLLKKYIMFIYESREVQAVVQMIRMRSRGVSAQEWFTENSDALITIVRFEDELVAKLDAIIEEFKDDELFPNMKEAIDQKSYEILVQVNEGLAESHNTYRIFEEEDFAGAYRKEIAKLFEERRKVIEKRKNKIKYLKFAGNISAEMVQILDDALHDDDTFDSLVNTLEMQIFNSRVASSKELRKDYKYNQ